MKAIIVVTFFIAVSAIVLFTFTEIQRILKSSLFTLVPTETQSLINNIRQEENILPFLTGSDAEGAFLSENIKRF